MLRAFRRGVLVTGTGTIGLGGIWYANQTDTQKLLVRNRLLGLRRAFRTGLVWLRLVAKYKYLAHHRPTNALDEASREKFKALKHDTHVAGAKLVLKLCQKNGGMFIKLGQHAASLRPAIPEEYIEALTLLQDRAPSKPLEQVVATLRSELPEERIQELIEGMDPHPLGSASLAQVHRCKLRNGKEIALKVQHFDLKNVMESDLMVIKALDWAATRLFPEEDYSLAWAVTEFEQNLKQELDFSREAANGTRMRGMIAKHPWLWNKVVVPEVDFTRSSNRVLAYEFADGARIRDCPDRLKPEMSQTVMQLFAAMIFTFGFVHCDPHFGNFLIRNGDEKLVLLDHGLYRELDLTFQLSHARLWRAMVTGAGLAEIKAASAEMGCLKYAELFPLLLTNRPVASSAKLGEPIPREELVLARQRSGFEKGMSLAQFTQIAEGVPVDMLFVLRTMHLVKDLHQMLGGTNRERFLAYARTASCAPEPYPPSWFGAARWHLVKFNLVFASHELAVDVRRWLMSYKAELDNHSRFSLSGLMGEKMERDLEGGDGDAEKERAAAKRKRWFTNLFKRKPQQQQPTPTVVVEEVSGG